MMKKNTSLKLLAITISILMIGIVFYLFSNFHKKKERVEALDSIPSFSVKDINGKTITNNHLIKGNKVLVYFNPSCEYCQIEMEELSKINHYHKDIQWIMLSSVPMDEIRIFAKQYQLDIASNINWCQDANAELYGKFEMTGIPYFLGYDANNKLVHRSKGAIKIEKVLAEFDEK